jgi:hypothetical protein
LIRVHGKIWVGANSALQTKLINAFHNSAMGGHSGVLPTYHRLKRLFSWSGMKQSVEDFRSPMCSLPASEACPHSPSWFASAIAHS